jgi:hypothetical protein
MRAFLKEALERKGALSAQATEATWWGSRCEGIPTAGIPGHAYIGGVGHKRPYKDVGDTTGVAKCGSDIGYRVPLWGQSVTTILLSKATSASLFRASKTPY